MKRALLFSLPLTLLLGGYVAWVAFKPKPSTAWWFAQVERGDVNQKVTATGTLNALTQVSVGTQVSGVVTALYADFNSVVKKGQIIARIDPSVNETLVANALSALRKNQAAADLARARINPGYCTITAPVDGVVDVGQTVAASFSTPSLLTIAKDLGRMKVQAAIDEADIGQIRVGQAGLFTVDSYPGMTFHGSVSEVQLNPTVANNAVTYIVVMEVANVPRPMDKRTPAKPPTTARYLPPGGAVYRGGMTLFPGMTANVTIVTAERKNVLRVPNLALRFNPADALGPSGNRLCVLDHGTPKAIPVRVDASGAQYSEVSGSSLSVGLAIQTGMDTAVPATVAASSLGGSFGPPPPH